MATLTIQDLEHHAGQDLGTSSWHVVTQERVDLFADATGDHQWIHVDRERAAAGPFGGTVAHGYLTLSLIPQLLAEVVEVTGADLAVNYGLNRVRFPAPLPTGSRVRASVECQAVQVCCRADTKPCFASQSSARAARSRCASRIRLSLTPSPQTKRWVPSHEPC
jgi:acyl dehydratase